MCFNQSCGAKGNLPQLVNRLDPSASKNVTRWIKEKKAERAALTDIEQVLAEELGLNTKKEEDWTEMVDSLQVNYDNKTEVESKLGYMVDRGFYPSTLRHFEVGWSDKKRRIVVPVRNENFKMVGVIGRAVDADRQPKYLYSDNLPKKGMLFNLCHAKTHKSVIVVEGSLDAMKVHQAGFPNVVAALGANCSDQQGQLFNRYFVDIIIFGDNDDAGKALGESVAHHCANRNIYYAKYPDGTSDPGGMTDEQIRWAVDNKESQIDVMFGRFFG